MKSRNKFNNFFIQGSILALAGIICRLIGAVYRMYMTGLLDSDGLAYYSRAYNVYNIALIVSSYGMPLAVSKLVAAKVTLKEYKNERRFLIGALSFATLTGLITALVVWFGADFFSVKLFNMPECALPLRVLAPTIFICAIMGTLRGYFQGNSTMLPTSISQIIEQLINAIVSVFATITFMKIFNNNKSYGAAGGTLGTTVGALSGCIFLIIVFIVFYKSKKNLIENDKTKNLESYKTIYKTILVTIVPIILSQTVYNVNSILDSSVFCHLNKSGNNDALLGGYDLYILMVSIPVAIATALSNSIVPYIVKEKVSNNINGLKNRIAMAIKFNMIIAIPSTIGLIVLAPNILSLLFKKSLVDLSANLLVVGGLAVVFYALSTILTAILQSLDMMKKPIINTVVALSVHLIFVIVFIKNGMGIISLAIGNVIFAFIVCVLNWISIAKNVEYKQEIKTTFIIPTISSIIMGCFALIICKLLLRITESNAVSTISSIIVAIFIYMIFIVKMGGIKREELLGFPKGNKIYSLFKKMHLMK